MKSLTVFRSAFNTVRKRYSILTVTALAVVAGVFLYYFLFLTSRSENLDRRQYRVLNRIESQLRTNLEGYKNLAVGQSRAALKELSEVYKLNNAQLEKKDDSLRMQMVRKHLDEISFIKNARLDIGNLVNVGARFDTLYISDEERVTVHHVEAIDSLFEISVTIPGQSKELRAARFDYVLSIGALIRPLLRYDMFSDFLILKDDTIIMETISSGLVRFRSDTVPGEISDNQHQTARRIVLNGNQYRVYEVGFSTESETGWSIIGLLREDDFSAQKRTLPRPYLFAIFILAVFIVLSVPFIKSLIMSRTERLGTTDVIFSAVSLAIATSVLTILTFDGYLRLDLDAGEQTEQLDSLSVMVERNLGNEISAIAEELNAYQQFVLPEKEKTVSNYQPEFYPYFSNLFVVKQDGYVEHDFSDDELSFNVEKRDYIKGVRSGALMQPGGTKHLVFLDAIISWREQQFRAAVSIPSKVSSHTAAVITTRLRSLTSPVLPPGTGFMIFDQKGMVLFHSDSSRSLNENLLEECNECPELEGAMLARTALVFDEEYSGVRSKIYVRPLKNTPYFIATYSRVAPVEAIHGQTFGFAFILQIVLFSFYVAIILIGIALTRKKSRLQLNAFDISSFTPTIAGNRRYVGGIMFNFLAGALLFVTVGLLDGSLATIMLFFLTAPYVVFLNMVLLSERELMSFIRPHQKLFILYACAIGVANYIIGYFTGMFWVLLLVQALILAVYFMIEQRKRSRRLDYFLIWMERRNGYRKSYTQLVFTLVALTCVLPALSFALITFNKEKEIAVKTVQHSVINQLANGPHPDSARPDKFLKLREYYGAFFHTTLDSGRNFCGPTDPSVEYYDAFTSVMRRQIQSSGELFSRLKFGAGDSLWRWCTTADDTLVITGRSSAGRYPDYNYQLKSAVPVFKLPLFYNAGWNHTLRFWAAGAGAVLLLYFVLRFFTGKIFAHEKYSRSRSLNFDQEFFDKMESGYKAFVTGMPAAGKSGYFGSKKNVLKLDFVATPASGWQAIINEANKPGEGVVIIDHFEHNVLDRELNKAKLELIEQLVSNKQKKVMIISSVSPSTYLNIFQRGNAEAPAEDEKLYERWNRVLAAFYDFVFPLQGYTQRSVPLAAEFALRLSQGENIAVPDKLIELVETECNHGTFLRAIGVELLQELHDRREISARMREEEKWDEREDLIIRTQNLAENYYRSLWNHLAVEEQFVLYDLAQDGLVNPKNLDIVEDLIDKGIIIYSTRLRIMNRSFRNYILTIAGPEDVSRLEVQVRDAGAWNKLKPALLLIVVALFLFIVKSDRSQLFGYFTAFAAIIPIVVGLFGVFNKAGKKE